MEAFRAFGPSERFTTKNPATLNLHTPKARRRLGLRIEISGVQAALLFRRVFPPPATGTLVFAGQNRTRAGLASNRTKSARLERVVGHVLRAAIVPHLARDPDGRPYVLQVL